MVQSFKELQVYQRSYSIALEIHKASLEFPKTEQYATASQIRRASKSICANLAEGFAKHHNSPAEFKRFIQICIGSGNEILVWLDFCKDLKYISDENWAHWYQEYTEINKMLFSLARSWKS